MGIIIAKGCERLENHNAQKELMERYRTANILAVQR